MVILKWNTLILIIITISSLLAVEDSTTEILKVITQENAEKTLRAQSLARDYFIQILTNIKNRLFQFKDYNIILENIIKGLHSRNLDPLKVIRERNFLNHTNEKPSLRQIAKIIYNMQGCNGATDYSTLRWETILKVVPDLSDSISPVPFLNIGDREFDLMDKINRPFVDLILLGVNEKIFTVSLRLLQSILLTYHFRPYLPDFIVLIKNVNERLESSGFKAFHMESKLKGTGLEETPTNILKSILSNIISRKIMEPQFAYQINQLLSALRIKRSSKQSRESTSIANWFLMMNNDEYPSDIVEAKDDLMSLLQNHSFMGIDLRGLQQDMRNYSPLEKLLGLLARLLILPLNSTVASKVHAIYPHVKLRYLANTERYFTPQSTTDVAFLLNSFLTIKNQVNAGLIQQINEIFLSREFDWSEILKGLDFSKYSRPRTLLLDILKALAMSQKLPACDIISIDYFVKSSYEDSCSKKDEKFVNILPQKLDGPATPLVAVSDVDLQSMTAAPSIYSYSSTPATIKNCSRGEPIKLVDPECLIEIIESKQHAGFIMNLIRYNPIYEEKYPYHTRYSVFHAVLNDLKNNKYKDDVSDFVISQAILRLPLNYKASYPPTYLYLCVDEIASMEFQAPTTVAPPTESTSSNDLVETTTFISNQCEKYILIVDAASLIEIINPIIEFPNIKKLVFEKPIIYEECKNWKTREQVLKALLENSRNIWNGTKLESEIKDFYAKWPVTWRGKLPPALLKSCGETTVTCDNESVQQDETPLQDISSIVSASTDIYTKYPYNNGTQTNSGSTLSSEQVKVSTESSAVQEKSSEYCASDEILMPIINTDSLFKALHSNSPKARFIKNRIRSYIIPIMPGNKYTIAEILRDILDRIEEEVKDPRVIKNMEILKKYIIYNGVGAEAPDIMYACLPKQKEWETVVGNLPTYQKYESTPFQFQRCPESACSISEVIISVIDTNCLFDVLKPNTPKNPYVENLVRAYIMPIDNVKIYAKGDVLRDVLRDLLKTASDVNVFEGITTFLENIMDGGPADERPATVKVCFPKEHLVNSAFQNNMDSSHFNQTLGAHMLCSLPAANYEPENNSVVVKETLKNESSISSSNAIETNEIFTTNKLVTSSTIPPFIPSARPLSPPSIFIGNATSANPVKIPIVSPLVNSPVFQPHTPQIAISNEYEQHNISPVSAVFSDHPALSLIPASVKPPAVVALESMPSPQSLPNAPPRPNHLLVSSSLPIPVHSITEAVVADSTFLTPTPLPGEDTFSALKEPTESDAEENTYSTLAESLTSESGMNVTAALTSATTISSIFSSHNNILSHDVPLNTVDMYFSASTQEPTIFGLQTAGFSYSSLPISESNSEDVKAVVAESPIIINVTQNIVPPTILKPHLSVAVLPSSNVTLSFSPESANESATSASEEGLESVVSSSIQSSPIVNFSAIAVHSTVSATSISMTSFSSPRQPSETVLVPISAPYQPVAVPITAVASEVFPAEFQSQSPIILPPITKPSAIISSTFVPSQHSSIGLTAQPMPIASIELSSSHQSSEATSPTSASHQINDSVTPDIVDAPKFDLNNATALPQNITEVLLPASTASNIIGVLCSGAIPAASSPSSLSEPVLPAKTPTLPLSPSPVFQAAGVAAVAGISQSSSLLPLIMGESTTRSQPEAITMPSPSFSFYSPAVHSTAAMSKLDSPTVPIFDTPPGEPEQLSPMHYDSSGSITVKNASFWIYQLNVSSYSPSVVSDMAVTQISDSGSPSAMNFSTVITPMAKVPAQYLKSNYTTENSSVSHVNTTIDKPLWTISSISDLNKTSSSVVSTNVMESSSSTSSKLFIPTVPPSQQHSKPLELTAPPAFFKISTSYNSSYEENLKTGIFNTSTGFFSLKPEVSASSTVTSQNLYPQYSNTALKSPPTETTTITPASPLVSLSASVVSLDAPYSPATEAFTSTYTEPPSKFPFDETQVHLTESPQQIRKVSATYSDLILTTLRPHRESAASQSSGISESRTKGLQPELHYTASHPQQISTTLPTIMGSEKPMKEVRLTDSSASFQAEEIAVGTATSTESIPTNGTEGKASNAAQGPPEHVAAGTTPLEGSLPTDRTTEGGKIVRETTEVYYSSTLKPEVAEILLESNWPVYIQKAKDAGNFSISEDFEFLRWPIMLNPKTSEICYDQKNKIHTSPIFFVNITSLFEILSGGSNEVDVYLTAMHLTSLDTYYKLYDFPFDRYGYKEDFLRDVLEYLLGTNDRTDIREHLKRVLGHIPKTKSNLLRLGTICNHQILEELPRPSPALEEGVSSASASTASPTSSAKVEIC